MAVSHSDEREGRAARSQSLFREVNERVREINEAFGEVIPLDDWLCECADDTCSERIALTHSNMRSCEMMAHGLSSRPSEAHFFPEDLTERTDRYWIVEKRGIAGVLTKKIDPRRIGLRGRSRRSALAVTRPS